MVNMENKVEEYSHVLEGRSQEVLHLCQGENWLRLVVSAGGLDLLADTQDEDLDGVPNPSIISLEEVGSVQWPTEDCYVCIDLDGESAAIKDMRSITDQDSEGFVVCLQKRLHSLTDHDESGDGPKQLRLYKASSSTVLTSCNSSFIGRAHNQPSQL